MPTIGQLRRVFSSFTLNAEKEVVEMYSDSTSFDILGERVIERPIPANRRPPARKATRESGEAEKVCDDIVASGEGGAGDSVRHRDGQEEQIEAPVEGIGRPSLVVISVAL